MSRKESESFVFNGSIRVTVDRIDEDYVLLSVFGPDNLPVFEGESPPSDNIDPINSYVDEPSVVTIFTLKKGKSMRIGNDCKINIVQIRTNKVRLGIDLPKEISLHRAEVYEAARKSLDTATTGDMGSGKREISIFVDPGDASEELLTEFYSAVSAYYQALGGSGLAIKKDERRSTVGEFA